MYGVEECSEVKWQAIAIRRRATLDGTDRANRHNRIREFDSLYRQTLLFIYSILFDVRAFSDYAIRLRGRSITGERVPSAGRERTRETVY